MSWEIVIMCVASSRQYASSQITCCTASYSWLWICDFVQLNHPAYSPDLTDTLSDNYLFRNLKCRLKLLLKHVLKDMTENSFSSRNKQLSKKVAKMHWCCRRLFWKMTLCLKVCGFSLCGNCKTFWTPCIYGWKVPALGQAYVSVIFTEAYGLV